LSGSKVLVTDASERAALAVIRSLGSKGVKVLAGDSTKLNAGFLSKYCWKRYLYPPPEREKSHFIKTLLSLVKKENIDLIIPITDFTMIPLVENKEELEEYTIVAAPPAEIALKAYDKLKTIQIAKKCKIPTPETKLINENDLFKQAAQIRYPVVIKPRMKVVWVGEKAYTFKVGESNYAYNKNDFVKKFKLINRKVQKLGLQKDFLMVQNYTGNGGYGVELLIQDSKLIAWFMHKRLREYPITGGASTLRESVFIKNLLPMSLRLLNEMKWSGVAMVEFKLGNSKATLMEVNGRFWGSLPLAVNSGVDFPYLLLKSLLYRDYNMTMSYKLGVKQKWTIPGELLWLYSSLKRGHLNAVINFLKTINIPDDIISFPDLKPAIGLLKTSFSLIIDVFKGKRSITGEIL